MNTSNQQQESFFGLGISPEILKRLEALHFIKPTPIQQKAIPVGVNGEDLVGIAQTGTGKTLAFAIPMIQKLRVSKKMGLIICPTRELAMQVDETLKKLAGIFGFKTVVIIGGDFIGRQIKMLRANPDVIVATPGRLIDHLQQKTISLSKVDVLVLDEADRMLDMGFEPQIRKILALVPTNRQTMLFSATMPSAISEIAAKYMKKPLRIEVAPSGTTVENVEQELFIVPKTQKMELLEKLLLEYNGPVLVFSRTKHGAKKMAQILSRNGHKTAELHSNRSLGQRKDALEGFKSGKYRILIATDIAARGIHVTGIELVVNFDLPDNSEDYVHRIGRTARAGRNGKAISFACPEQKRDIEAIERLIRIRLPIVDLPGLTHKQFQDVPFARGKGGRGGHGGYGGRGGHGHGGQGGRGGYGGHGGHGGHSGHGPGKRGGSQGRRRFGRSSGR